MSDLGKTYTQSYNDWLDKHDKDIRADERKRFVEWCKTKGYSCYDWRMLLEQYEAEKKECVNTMK